MWFLVKHFSERKAYDDLKRFEKTGVNKRFTELVANLPDNLRQIYFERIIQSATKEPYAYYRQIFIVVKLYLESDGSQEGLGEQIVQCLLVRIHKNQQVEHDLFGLRSQRINRKSLEAVKQIIDKASRELFVKICKLKVL